MEIDKEVEIAPFRLKPPGCGRTEQVEPPDMVSPAELFQFSSPLSNVRNHHSFSWGRVRFDNDFAVAVHADPFDRREGRRVASPTLGSQLFDGELADLLSNQDPVLRYPDMW